MGRTARQAFDMADAAGRVGAYVHKDRLRVMVMGEDEVLSRAPRLVVAVGCNMYWVVVMGVEGVLAGAAGLVVAVGCNTNWVVLFGAKGVLSREAGLVVAGGSCVVCQPTHRAMAFDVVDAPGGVGASGHKDWPGVVVSSRGGRDGGGGRAGRCRRQLHGMPGTAPRHGC